MRVVQLGDEAALDRGDALRRVNQMRLDIGRFAEAAADRGRGFVGADHAEEVAMGVQRGNVAGHVTGATDRLFDLVEINDGRGRLRRYPADATVAEAIQHQIADDEDAPGGELRQNGFERCPGIRMVSFLHSI
jgi:hypothetical protein